MPPIMSRPNWAPSGRSCRPARLAAQLGARHRWTQLETGRGRTCSSLEVSSYRRARPCRLFFSPLLSLLSFWWPILAHQKLASWRACQLASLPTSELARGGTLAKECGRHCLGRVRRIIRMRAVSGACCVPCAFWPLFTLCSLLDSLCFARAPDCVRQTVCGRLCAALALPHTVSGRQPAGCNQRVPCECISHQARKLCSPKLARLIQIA